MREPRRDPRRRPVPDRLTWDKVLASYGLIAAIALVLWAVSNPLAGSLAFGTIAGLLYGARRTAPLVRCFYNCRRLAFDVGDRARITIERPPVDEPC